MLNREWKQEDMPVLCDQATWLLQIAQQGFFSQVGDHFTNEQYEEGLAALTKLYEQVRATMHPLHYRSASGRAQHFCLDLALEAVKFRLKGLLICRQPPAPPLPPPKKKPLTPEETVRYLEEVIQQSAQDTYLGDTAEEEEEQEG